MMKKGLFLYGHDVLENVRFKNGIDRKVLSQIKAFNNLGIECKQICYPTEKKSWLYSLKVRLPFCNACPKWIYLPDFENIDYLYFRRHAAVTMYELRILDLIKKRNPCVKIILEIPTFPYDKELAYKYKNYPLLWKDRYNRKFLHQYIDRVVTVSDDDFIFNIPTIKIVNGVDVKSITPIQPQSQQNDTIHIIGVAMLTVWHGYDRLIKGLGEYYKKGGNRNIIFHIVGEGEAVLITSYKKIIDEYNIHSHIIFHGYQTGEELDCIYNLCKIAVISLGTHRKNIHKLSTLKSREYLSKGLPVFASGMTDVFEKNDFKYNLEIPSDETFVAMENVIDFYDHIYNTTRQEKVISEIRAFALNTIDIHLSMAPVVNFLKE